MRKQSVLSVPSQAAASNQPNIRLNYFSTLLLQTVYLSSCIYPGAFRSKRSFLINSSSQDRQ